MKIVLESRHSLLLNRKQLIARYQKKRLSPETFLSKLSQSIDTHIKAIIKHYPLPDDAALCAVGGYGRKELFPFSDIDILILLAHEPKAKDKKRLEKFIQVLWDLGLDIGSSVRTINDCLAEAQKEITIETSLLECRFITGKRRLYHQLIKQFKAIHDPQQFFIAKQLEMKHRYARYNDTPYALEPNCKESPGALRDIQLIRWLALSNNLGRTWVELVHKGFMTQKEADVITKTEHAFKRVRIELHLIHNKRDERVLFHVQPLLAKVYDYEPQANKRASEAFMQDYYGAARLVNLILHFMVQHFSSYLFPEQHARHTVIDDDFQCLGQRLDVRRDTAFEEKPHLLLKAFLVLQQHTELDDFTVRTQRLIWSERKRVDAAFRANPENQKNFLAILQQPTGIVHTFRRLSKLKILPRYIPMWQKIVGQMQHDLFHVYTVDQHTLQVIRNIRRFTMPEYAHENTFASKLMADVDKSWLLYIAALFHDIAKGRGGDHSELGATDVAAFAEQHGLPQDDIDLLVFLVKHHLEMSLVAQKKDLSDPQVIKDFSLIVKNKRYLAALYLLTVADMRGTSPKIWNAWKGQLLQNLYQHTVLLFDADHFDAHTMLSMRKAQANRLIQAKHLSEKERDAFWSIMDIAYFLRHEAADIAWHTYHLHNQTNTEKSIVKAKFIGKSEHLQLFVFTKDKANLFKEIAAYFYIHNINVLDARIHTSAHQYALDSFVLSSPAFSNTKTTVSTLENELSTTLNNSDTIDLSSVNNQRRAVVGSNIRRSRTFPILPTVKLNKDEYSASWLLSIVTTDCPGILYHLSCLFVKHHIHVQMAKIMTLGDRVEDIFLISSPLLNTEKLQLALEKDILELLNQLTQSN